MSKPIAAKEIGFVSYLINLFLLEHSTEIPEFWIRSEEEYRLYSELKRTINITSINDEDHNLTFKFNDFMLSFDDGKISVSKGRNIFAQYAIADFSRSPNTVFRLMKKDMIDGQLLIL